MNEIRERESENEAANKVAAEKKAHATRLHEANLDVGYLAPFMGVRTGQSCMGLSMIACSISTVA